MIFITTSNGVYLVNDHNTKSKCILSNKHTPGLFQKRSKGYFGICFQKQNNAIIVASRETLGSKKTDKPTTDCKLHRIDPVSLEHEVIATIYDCHDVHQIACHRNMIYLTDTGKNRIHVYDTQKRHISRIINIGSLREDINHINAVHCADNEILVGLNNRGNEESAVLTLTYTQIEQLNAFEIDGILLGKKITLGEIYHTHDIEPLYEDYLFSASHDGIVYRVSDKKVLLRPEGWVRGICQDNNKLWIGISHQAKRSKRHSKSIDGTIRCYSLKTMELLKTVTLEGAGQVNDLIKI